MAKLLSETFSKSTVNENHLQVDLCWVLFVPDTKYIDWLID